MGFVKDLEEEHGDGIEGWGGGVAAAAAAGFAAQVKSRLTKDQEAETAPVVARLTREEDTFLFPPECGRT